jgi:nucleoside-diphosphate-sugar epimerase
MRIFVTGASGFVGSAVVQELLAAGHKVVGLARSDKAAELLKLAGAEVCRGSIEELESLRAAAAASDGVIHTAFNHDFSRFKENCELDRHAIETLGAALVGSNRPLIVTSPIGVLPKGLISTEATAPASGAQAHPRAAAEEAADGLAARGVRVATVRLPPSVHGAGDHAFIPALIGIARQKGASAYLADGANRWPAVGRLDAAQLYRLALEKAVPGARYHAVAEEGILFRDIAEVIGRILKLPVISKPPHEAASHFTWLANFVAMDVPASSTQTQQQLGWTPTLPGLIADLEQGHYLRDSLA